MRHLLITGVSGFTGEYLARYFHARGWLVAGTYLTNPIEIPGVDVVAVDLSDSAAVDRLVRDMKPWAVVHCAAATNAGWCETNPAEAEAAILTATQNLCTAIRSRGPETRLIAFSTDLVFDGTEAPYNEDAAAKPLNVYGSLKWRSESQVLALPQGTVLRSALIYGPPATHRGSFLSWMHESLRLGKPLNLFEDEWRTPVWIDDLASAVRLLLEESTETTAGRIFHAGGADRVDRVTMGKTFCDVFGFSPDPIRAIKRHDVPGGTLRARDVSLGCERLRSLGWSPANFRNGLEQCLLQWQTKK